VPRRGSRRSHRPCGIARTDGNGAITRRGRGSRPLHGPRPPPYCRTEHRIWLSHLSRALGAPPSDPGNRPSVDRGVRGRHDGRTPGPPAGYAFPRRGEVRLSLEPADGSFWPLVRESSRIRHRQAIHGSRGWIGLRPAPLIRPGAPWGDHSIYCNRHAILRLVAFDHPSRQDPPNSAALGKIPHLNSTILGVSIFLCSGSEASR
jgi:hypothetical protein